MDVLITGGSRGIGRATCLRLARDGARIAVGYHLNEAAAAEVCREIQAAGGQAFAIQGDVRSPAVLERMAAEVGDRFGGLDVLVHNAAMAALKPFDKLRVSGWDLTMESSLRPFWLLTKLCAPLLRDGGTVIGISSLGSRQFTPGYIAMGAAKGGMEAMVRQLAVELGPRRIRVNCVCGGLIETDALRYLPESDRLREHVGMATPLGRVGEPDDLAGAIALLCSPDARWINGQVLVVDGGMSCV